MTLTFRQCRLNGRGELCVQVDDMAALKAFLDTFKAGEKYELKVERCRQKRSNNANAYLWTLCERLAQALSDDGDLYSKEDVYIRHIKHAGVYQDITVNKKAASALMTVWQAYGTGWPCERVDSDGEDAVIRCYYGSSTYNTKQMSRLLDSVVQDCVAVGVETMPPEKLDLLLEDWGEKRIRAEHHAG